MNLKKIFLNENLIINTIPIKHGLINSMSFIINNKIVIFLMLIKFMIKIWRNLKLKYLVIDCLRYTKHPSHFNVSDILILLNKMLKPRKMLLTNLHSDLEYKVLLDMLPNNIQPAYDGLTLKI